MSSENISSNGLQDDQTETQGPSSEELESSPNVSPTDEHQLTEPEKAQAVADLLAGQARPIEDGDGGEDVTPEQQRVTPKSLTQAQEMLGLDDKALYAMQIPTGTGDGDTMTLGEMKDLAVRSKTAQVETTRRQADLDARETEHIAERDMLFAIQDRFKGLTTQAQRDAIGRQYQERDARENRALLAAAPEFQDPVKFEAFKTEAVAFLEKRGFSGQQMIMTDHAQALLVRDFMRAQKRLDGLRNYKPPKTLPSKSKSAGRTTPDARKASQAARRAAHNGTEADKVAAVAKLFK